MAKQKKNTSSSSKKSVTLDYKFFAFLCLVFAGAAILLGGIFGKLLRRYSTLSARSL